MRLISCAPCCLTHVVAAVAAACACASCRDHGPSNPHAPSNNATSAIAPCPCARGGFPRLRRKFPTSGCKPSRRRTMCILGGSARHRSPRAQEGRKHSSTNFRARSFVSTSRSALRWEHVAGRAEPPRMHMVAAAASFSTAAAASCDHGHSGPPPSPPSRPLPLRRPPVSQRTFHSPEVERQLEAMLNRSWLVRTGPSNGGPPPQRYHPHTPRSRPAHTHPATHPRTAGRTRSCAPNSNSSPTPNPCLSLQLGPRAAHALPQLHAQHARHDRLASAHRGRPVAHHLHLDWRYRGHVAARLAEPGAPHSPLDRTGP